MATESYVKKQIRVDVAMADGGATKIQSFEGFATAVKVSKEGAPELPKAAIGIAGLSLDTMAQLTRLAFDPLTKRNNKVEVSAGEAGTVLASIFKGEITSAWADFNQAPSIVFQIEARSASFPSLIPQSPISVKGQQSAAGLIEGLCKEIGYSFENNGVTASVSNCVINGDPIRKMRWIASSVGANLIIDDDSVVLVAKSGTRQPRGGIPLINAGNGMIGYPTFDDQGISVSCFFRPELRIGATVRVESIVPRATGLWKITSLEHELSANNPGGGDWKTTISGSYVKNG